MFSKIETNNETKEAKETNETKEAKKAKKKKPKTKELNSITLDLEKTPSIIQEKQATSIIEDKEPLNNIDLLYLTNQHRYFKPNKAESVITNNYLLKSIYNKLDENISFFQDEIINTNNSNLKELLENKTYSEGQEKHKLYYLLYVLNLIQHLKEKKIQNLICEDLKEYSNNYKTTQPQTLNSDEFNIVNETLKLMPSSSSTSKKLTNIDLMVTKKTNNSAKKILPQKWE